MRSFIFGILLILAGCVNPTAQYLNTLMNTAAEPQLREKFGPPLNRTEILEGPYKGHYILTFREEQPDGILGGTCWFYYMQFDAEHILRARNGNTCSRRR